MLMKAASVRHRKNAVKKFIAVAMVIRLATRRLVAHVLVMMVGRAKTARRSSLAPVLTAAVMVLHPATA
jgi:hypothetical protein